LNQLNHYHQGSGYGGVGRNRLNGRGYVESSFFEKNFAMGHTVNLIRRAIIIKSQDRISSLQRTMAIVAIFQMRLSSRVRA